SLFFFFQAEDGIRDRNVTGVQTCALPLILRRLNWWPACFRIPTIRVFNLPHHLSFFLNLFEFLVYIYDTCTLLCASSRFKSVVYFFRQQFNQLCSIVRQRQYEVHSCLSLR